MPAESEDLEDVIVQALSEPEFADGLRALHHRHLWLDANARYFIAKQVVEALGLEQVGWMVLEDPQDSDSWIAVRLDFEDLIHYPHRPLFTAIPPSLSGSSGGEG